MEQIEVTARFDAHGQINPLGFVWKGRSYRVESIGRTWKADDGIHILVMTIRNRVYHLLFKPDKACWYLLCGGSVPTMHEA